MPRRIFSLSIVFLWAATVAAGQTKLATWRGVLRDAAGKPVAGAQLELRASGGEAPPTPLHIYSARTDANGAFSFPQVSPGAYRVSVAWQGRVAKLGEPLDLSAGEPLQAQLELSQDLKRLALRQAAGRDVSVSGGSERLSSQEVSSLPLNKRDFSQLLLQAAGTMTDTNGAANFTQQFAVNGQRGTTAVFAIDGLYASDPELGGATFANFNVDAIQEIQSNSGVMPAEVGQGAAGFTNVVTKSGTELLHGAVFEFVRNATFDARNFFDRRNPEQLGRIPPFQRNEFGVTSGGPLVRKRTYYFGQYQGFRQVLSTTQVLSVPTLAERQGINTTAFPGDTLMVPVNPKIAPVLGRYPLPNDPQGAYGPRTYATSAKIATFSNQFSVRIDHRLSDRSQLFARFNFNNVNGPINNPSQIAIDPSFAVRFLDHQRAFGLTYTRTVSPNLVSESALGILRTTPIFDPVSRTQPGLVFGDNLYEPFNSTAGTIIGAFGNLFQGRQSFSYARGAHTVKLGGEARFNLDTSFFVYGPNGSYTFGGGTAYSPVAIPSASGLRNVRAGDVLPDTLSAFLTATPFSFSTETAPEQLGQSARIGEGAVRRHAYNVYVQDSWKVTPRLTLDYGVRYELNPPFTEAKHRTSGIRFVGPNGQAVRFWDPGARNQELYYPQPPYQTDWRGWGPRMTLEWRATDKTVLHAGGSIATVLPNIFQNNFLSSGLPFVFSLYIAATAQTATPFQNSVVLFSYPQMFATSGQPLLAGGRPSTAVPANTEMDLARFEQDLAAATPGHQFQPLSLFSISRNFRNGYIENWTAGLDRDLGDVKLSVSYVGTAGVKLASILFPNNYGGASPGFAPFTQFDSSGNVVGGFGPEYFMSNRSHSTYHSLQMSLAKTSARAGLGFQASYTFSKTIDDTSNVYGGFGGGSGNVLQTFPADPRNPRLEKGPSTFDLRHVAVFSVIQALPFDRAEFLRRLGRRLVSGWQFLNISTLTSGPPFSVTSGVQQTGLGSPSTSPDRPNQISQPSFSTSRTVREDYFGQGASNGSFFFIPIGLPGGTGPNQGRLGTLGRNTFRGPIFHNFDAALIKDTPFGRRAGGEAVTLQFRAEFFNVFNLVNFGLPNNVIRGTGFGFISRTAGSSRQVQLSLKLIY